MISVKITSDSQRRLYAEIQNKINGSKELTSLKTRSEILDATFALSSVEFVKTTNLRARSFSSSFHHVYEWGQVGRESGRLFRVFHTKRSSSSSVYYKFNNSRKVVPVSQSLKTPGPTGKYVKRSKIFKNKAEVMESGKPVSFTTAKTIVFPSSDGSLRFVPPGRNILIKSPGGEETTGAFSKHFISWWMTKPQEILQKNGVYLNLQNSVARSLNVTGAGRSAASSAVSRTLRGYSIVGSAI